MTFLWEQTKIVVVQIPYAGNQLGWFEDGVTLVAKEIKNPKYYPIEDEE